jgi:hypothetical protein
MPPTLHVWKSPRPADAAEAAAILASASFESSDDVRWFARELAGDAPPIWNPDAAPRGGPYPDTVVAVPIPEPSGDDAAGSGDGAGWGDGAGSGDGAGRGDGTGWAHPGLHEAAVRDLLADVFGLATKYDLIVFEPDRGIVTAPSEAMAAHASATFWPGGAIRSIVATVIALGVAAGAFAVGIPIVSGVVVLFALFMAAIFAFTIVSEARKRIGGAEDPGVRSR